MDLRALKVPMRPSRSTPRGLVGAGSSIVQRMVSSRHGIHLLVWILIILSFSTYRHRSAEELLSSSWLDWQIMLEASIWLALGAVAVVGLLRGWIDLRRLRFAPLSILAVFIVYAFLSASHAPSPAFSAFRGFQLAVAFLLVLMPGVDKDLLYKAMFVYAVMSLVGAGIGGLSRGDSLWDAWYRLASIFGHPSIISIAAAVGAAGLWARWLDRGLNPTGLVMLVCLVFSTLATISRTAILGLLIAMAFTLVAVPRLRGWIAAGWALVATVILELFTGAVGQFLIRGQSRFELLTLTERTVVWKATLQRVPGAGPFGEGLASTRFAPALEVVGLGHAHNIVLEALVTLGWIGGALLAAVLLSWAWRLLSFRYLGHGRWLVRIVNVETIAIWVPLAMFCMLDRGFLSLSDPLLPTYLAAMRIAQDDNLRNLTGSAVPQRVRTRRSRRITADPSPSQAKGRSSIR